MSVPDIVTQRLQLRQRGLVDFDDCLRMDRDPDVTEFVKGPWNNPEQHSAFLTERMQTNYPDGLGYWTVRLLGYWTVRLKDADQGFLGWIMLLPDDPDRECAEIGWRFNRKTWGKGYGTEAAKAVLEYAQTFLKLPRIFAEIDQRNIGSIRVAEKLGMLAVGRSTDAGQGDLVFVVEDKK
ncbi:GNAT family N-acetyltransferase [Parasedimentitalea huanghaiensis]|uniref:GNAT family N-acetyltransferase n=1 Tax=Parasedimentitalea huanghaiensis TaxID=2682100 RepID=A0A6L6WIK8_9RHOB|nr:GNAT family N-acetyltransferase [Zongyanglinia huanghaiensis]MVO17161.1 GNAT family N-acetyltransferase [Zongyanglinia huanghaiensis]